ncbi:MAG: mammalian cell entry protein [Mycobacterium sp.]
MEDQQPDSGDLNTDDATVAADGTAEDSGSKPRRGLFRRRTKADAKKTPVDAEPVEEPETQPEAPKTPVGKAARAPKAEVIQAVSHEPAEPVTEPGTDLEDQEPAEEPAEEVTLVPHRPAGKRLKVAALAASVLFVGAGAFAGAMVQPYLAESALVETKLNIAQTAADAITTLWTYTPDDMNTLADRASRYLGGEFAEEYRQYIDAIVEPNKQAQVTNTTDVMGAAVESVSPPGTPDEATAIVYTNSVATSPVTKNIPSLRYLSYRLTMQRDGSDWLITRMSTVTSFDLTPQL